MSSPKKPRLIRPAHRSYKIIRVYQIESTNHVVKSKPKKHTDVLPPIIPIISEPKQNITNMQINENLTTFKTIPSWFEDQGQEQVHSGMVCPSGTTNVRPYESIARYRTAINKSKDFKHKAIEVGDNHTETIIIALDAFAKQFGGELSFTNNEISFNQSIYQTACGIANLGSVHLLATDYLPTIKFAFLIDLDYQRDLAKSEETMKNFILAFSTAIAEELQCENNYIRVLSIEKCQKEKGKAKINIGLTTPDQSETRTLAKDLKRRAQRGFPKNKILKYIKPGEYTCKTRSLLTYLQLQPSDFDTKHNFDYKKKGVPVKDQRGGYPYNLPISWYRHALDMSTKYTGDNLWLGCENIPGEWPVAFHGTHSQAASGITKDGFAISKVEHDLMKDEAIKQMGLEADQPGLYLATHCKGGAHPAYTKTFSVPMPGGKTERFRIVFQCRVKPGSFTRHTTPVNIGEAWRVVDPNAVRPYGILVKKRKAPKKHGYLSESDDESN